MHVELRVDVAHVSFHRVVRQHELFLNDGARAPACKQFEHFGFARGEAMFLGNGGACDFECGLVGLLPGAFYKLGFFRGQGGCIASPAFLAKLSVWAGLMPSMVSAKL